MAKSNKQRRAELTAKRQARAEKERLQKEADQSAPLTRKGVPVDVSKLAPDGSYGSPLFVTRGYYLDVQFVCQTCGKEQIWTGSQQKWWYEVAKGGVWTTARLCRQCRKRECERRQEARRIHFEGLQRKKLRRK